MSKSLGNYIGIAEAPQEMFGKLMSISDPLMWRYIDLLSFESAATIGKWRQEVETGRNPREVKVRFAKEIVARFHGTKAADAAAAEFEQRFRHGVLPDDMPEVKVVIAGAVTMAEVLKLAGLVDGPMPLDYFVWLVRGGGRELVVDTGFSSAMAAKRGREHLRCPTHGLRLLGVDAASVKDVVITHLHYDHVGNFELFPAATLHLQ